MHLKNVAVGNAEKLKELVKMKGKSEGPQNKDVRSNT